VLATLLLAACAPTPRPSVLAEVEQVRRGAAAEEARRHAPGAFAHAEKLRREASVAFEAGDLAGSQMVGERAIAAYAHAHALARAGRAEEAQAQALRSLEAARAELTTIDADQARVAAELDALDMKIKVARDAQPVVPSRKADPEREKARLDAARALSLQARMLCAAARLLMVPAPPAAAPSAPAAPGALAAQLNEATQAVEKLDAELAGQVAAPIDQASRVRAGCLAALTAARRAATPVSHAPGAGDALLAALSASGGWSPVRDDRGVVVTLRNLFAGSSLTPAGEGRLRELAQVAAAHPAFPIAVVLHSDREPPSPRDDGVLRARADAVVGALRAAKVQRMEAVVAGARAPLVDPAGRERGRNARVEIVFVTPETF
jgi:outer membrane protein OmpA-like peptidoglycan-associated protein